MREQFKIFSVLPLLLVLVTGCGNLASQMHSSVAPGLVQDGQTTPSSIARVLPTPVNSMHDLFENMPQGTASLGDLCAGNTGTDKFTSVFCGANPPAIDSLASLYSALGLTNTANVACTTASGSIYKNETSVLTPRCFRFSAAGADPNAITVAYLRSNQTFTEIAAFDPVSNGFRFFLIKFDLPCEATGTCTPADYLTLTAESNWQNVSFYEDKALKNTPMDCRLCHQTGGVSAQKSLRMIETQSPWEHWFQNTLPCGQALLADWAGAHSTEDLYAGLTPAQINNSNPAKMEAFVEYNGSLGFQFGNDMYDSAQIEYEVSLTTGQPQNNATPGTSPTWQALYNQQIDGTNLLAFGATTIPYHDCKQSDPNKLATYTSNFLGVVAGTVPKSASLNLADVNLATPQALADRSLNPAIGLMTAQQILTNSCLACHNSNLDQTDSRAQFNVEDLTKNTAFEYGTAMGRIQRAATDIHRMPPPTYMNLTDSDITTLMKFFASQGGT